MSRLIGKLAVIAVSVVASGTAAAVVAVKKTDVGAKLWTGALENYEIQKTRIHTVYADGCAASKAKFNNLKVKAGAKGEAKAVADMLVKDEDLYETMKAMLAQRAAAHRAATIVAQ
jgi:hypothetical protein